MRFLILSAFTVLVNSSWLASATSLPSLAKGAAFFITNEPSGNHIISANIGTDGRLTFGSAVSAGGQGADGIQTAVGDPLFSSDCIKVSPAGNFLAAVNAGSNTVAAFAMNPQTPSKITMVGSPVFSGGDFPVSLAINRNGDQLCVLNGGAVNGVQCFSFDQRLGLIAQADTLRSLGINQTTPAFGILGSVSDIIYSEDDTQLIVSVKGLPPALGFLATWDFAKDGSLSQDYTKSIAGSFAPFGMAIVPGTNGILVSDAAVGFEVFTFYGDNATASVVPIPNQQATCWTTYSPKTGNYYLSDPTLSILNEVHVYHNLTGSLVRQHVQRNGTSVLDTDLATIGDDEYLYALSPLTLTIEVLEPVAPGQLTNVQSFDFSAGAQRANVTVNPLNLQGMTVFFGAR